MRKSLTVVMMIVAFFASGCSDVGEKSNPVSKVISRNALQSQARRLVELGRYDQAIVKYREAMNPEYISYENELGTSVFSITHLLKLQGKYDEAMREHSWYLRPSHDLKKTDPSSAAIEGMRELESLREFGRTGDAKYVMTHIQAVRSDHAHELPPQRYNSSGMTPMIISDLIFLYDTIGDYDAGIAFIDEILDWDREHNPEHKGINVTSTAEIGEQYIFRLRDGVQHHPRWRAYKWIREFLLIREAFEQDKAEGKQGSFKDGKPGRATLALIRSDYFPW